MEMYKVHQEAVLLPVEVKTPEYVVGKEKLPAVSASASRDRSGRLHVSLVNIDAARAHPIALTLPAGALKTVTGRSLTAARLQDHNTFETPDRIKPATFKGATLRGDKLTLQLPPFSVVVLALQ
jgi:alpha-N-arabinofuranosidase